MADPGNGNTGWKGRLGDLSVELITVGTIALIGTCIRVWAGMDVIQTQINNLVKNDNQQDGRIETVRSEVNNLRIHVGVLRAQMAASLSRHGRP